VKKKHFWQVFGTIKKVFQILSARIILVLDAAFVPNLTFLGLLSPEISPTHPDGHPGYFTTRESLRNKNVTEVKLAI